MLASPVMASVSAPPAGRSDLPRSGIHPNVMWLGITSLFTDVSTEMLVPVLPLFVTATLGASVTSLGLIEGAAESAASLLRLTSGWLNRSSIKSNVAASSHCKSSRNRASGCSGRANTLMERRKTSWNRF